MKQIALFASETAPARKIAPLLSLLYYLVAIGGGQGNEICKLDIA
jgi:hypothetical protein